MVYAIQILVYSKDYILYTIKILYYIILLESSIFFYVLCDYILWLVTVTHMTWCVTVVTITYNIILTPNSKSKIENKIKIRK